MLHLLEVVTLHRLVGGQCGPCRHITHPISDPGRSDQHRRKQQKTELQWLHDAPWERIPTSKCHDPNGSVYNTSISHSHTFIIKAWQASTAWMISSNGKIFHVTDPLWEEFIGHSLVNSPHKGQWREALMFSLICARINGWVNNGYAGNLRHHRASSADTDSLTLHPCGLWTPPLPGVERQYFNQDEPNTLLHFSECSEKTLKKKIKQTKVASTLACGTAPHRLGIHNE